MNQESGDNNLTTISSIHEKVILDDLNALSGFASIKVFLTQSTHYLTSEQILY